MNVNNMKNETYEKMSDNSFKVVNTVVEEKIINLSELKVERVMRLQIKNDLIKRHASELQLIDDEINLLTNRIFEAEKLGVT